MAIYDVIVVGSGIAGLSTAYMLAERGLDVALVGPVELSELIGENTAGILTYHMREPFSSWALRTYEFYRRLGDDVVEKVDTIWILHDRELLEDLAVKVSSYGLRLREISSSELREITGRSINVQDEETIALTDGLRYNVRKLHRTLLAKMQELDVKIISGWAELRDERILVNGDELVGEKIIVACGPWTREMLSLSSLSIYKCQLAKLSPDLKTPVLDDVLNFYYNILPGGEAVLGDGVEVIVNNIVEAMEPDSDILSAIVSKAIQRGVLSRDPGSLKPISAPCIGTSDGYPVVGRVDNRVYVITGFNGAGYSIAPAVAEILVGHILDDREIPRELSPERDMRIGRVLEPIDIT